MEFSIESELSKDAVFRFEACVTSNVMVSGVGFAGSPRTSRYWKPL